MEFQHGYDVVFYLAESVASCFLFIGETPYCSARNLVVASESGCGSK